MEVAERVVVNSRFMMGDGTPESPLTLNVPALTAAIVNSMSYANFAALKAGISICDTGTGLGCISIGG